jgi:hypothetical protein
MTGLEIFFQKLANKINDQQKRLEEIQADYDAIQSDIDTLNDYLNNPIEDFEDYYETTKDIINRRSPSSIPENNLKKALVEFYSEPTEDNAKMLQVIMKLLNKKLLNDRQTLHIIQSKLSDYKSIMLSFSDDHKRLIKPFDSYYTFGLLKRFLHDEFDNNIDGAASILNDINNMNIVAIKKKKENIEIERRKKEAEKIFEQNQRKTPRKATKQKEKISITDENACSILNENELLIYNEAKSLLSNNKERLNNNDSEISGIYEISCEDEAFDYDFFNENDKNLNLILYCMNEFVNTMNSKNKTKQIKKIKETIIAYNKYYPLVKGMEDEIKKVKEAEKQFENGLSTINAAVIYYNKMMSKLNENQINILQSLDKIYADYNEKLLDLSDEITEENIEDKKDEIKKKYDEMAKEIIKNDNILSLEFYAHYAAFKPVIEDYNLYINCPIDDKDKLDYLNLLLNNVEKVNAEFIKIDEENSKKVQSPEDIDEEEKEDIELANRPDQNIVIFFRLPNGITGIEESFNNRKQKVRLQDEDYDSINKSVIRLKKDDIDSIRRLSMSADLNGDLNGNRKLRKKDTRTIYRYIKISDFGISDHIACFLVLTAGVKSNELDLYDYIHQKSTKKNIATFLNKINKNLAEIKKTCKTEEEFNTSAINYLKELQDKDIDLINILKNGGSQKGGNVNGLQ